MQHPCCTKLVRLQIYCIIVFSAENLFSSFCIKTLRSGAAPCSLEVKIWYLTMSTNKYVQIWSVTVLALLPSTRSSLEKRIYDERSFRTASLVCQINTPWTVPDHMWKFPTPDYRGNKLESLPVSSNKENDRREAVCTAMYTENTGNTSFVVFITLSKVALISI